MNTIENRRSQRLLLDVPVIVRGESARQQAFQEETFTIVVSAHGALVVLAAKVALGQRLLLRNPKTGDEREGRVASLGSPYGGLTQVGIAFTCPSPEFWPLNPAPDAWNTDSRQS